MLSGVSACARGPFCTHPISKRDVMGSNPIGSFACLCRPIQSVCTSLGPTKPGRGDLDSIFQEEEEEEGRLLWWENCLNHPAALLAMCQPWRPQTSASRQPKQAAFGAVRSIGMRTSIIPAAFPAGDGGRSAHYLSSVKAFIRSLFSLVGRAPAP